MKNTILVFCIYQPVCDVMSCDVTLITTYVRTCRERSDRDSWWRRYWEEHQELHEHHTISYQTSSNPATERRTFTFLVFDCTVYFYICTKLVLVNLLLTLASLFLCPGSGPAYIHHFILISEVKIRKRKNELLLPGKETKLKVWL